ncbi:MAG: platelet-activating factor acetylhydrolase IB subunit [Chthoniobacteraceae bacterium]
MKNLAPSIALAILLAGSTTFAENKPAAPAAPAPAKPAAPAVKLPPQPPDVAAPKLGPDGKPNAGFIKSHENFVAIAKKGDTRLLFLGDSITAGWNGQKATWEKAFGAYKPANFGIGGDRTQHVLWRIENGELDGIHPKVAVLMIGTNNSGSDPADRIAKGVTKIVETIREKSPKTKVLLLAVFPRGEKPNAQREKLQQVNATIQKLHDGKSVFFLDIGAKFLQPDGTLTKEIMPDFLHLSAKGYEIWADAISPKLAELMK